MKTIINGRSYNTQVSTMIGHHTYSKTELEYNVSVVEEMYRGRFCGCFLYTAKHYYTMEKYSKYVETKEFIQPYTDIEAQEWIDYHQKQYCEKMIELKKKEYGKDYVAVRRGEGMYDYSFIEVDKKNY